MSLPPTRPSARRAALILLLAGAPALAAQQTDSEPPPDVGLAGSPTPDIARFLAVRTASGPSLSRDGEQLSFITSTTGQPQLWAVSIASGYPGVPAPRQLTFRAAGVTAGAWSPAGGWILYSTGSTSAGRDGYFLIAPDGADERELLAPADTDRRFGVWSPDGSRFAFTAAAPGDTDFVVYLVSIAADGTTGAPQRALAGAGELTVAAWRPDGGALVLARARGPTANDLLELDLGSGHLDTLFAPDSAASFRDIAWTPDGRGFYLATDDGRDVPGLAYYDTTARALTWIGVSRHEVHDVALSPSGRWLAWTENVDGYSALHLLDLTGSGGEEHPDVPEGVYRIAWAPHAPVLSIRVAGPHVPGDVFAYDAAVHRLTRATRSTAAGLDLDRFVAPRPVSFPSWDNDTIHGLLYLPPGTGKRRPPVLVGLHDTASGQALPTYRPLFQYLLARGIAVLDLDYRGSTGFGRRFEQITDDSAHTGAVRDVAGAVDWLAHSRLADTSRVAVLGAAYGGWLARTAAATLGSRIKAGVVMDVAPAAATDSAATPLLVTDGADGTHGPAARIRAYRRIAAFLEQALLPAAPAH